jgi:acyl transferase domain-containing protein/acyl carrier protein
VSAAALDEYRARLRDALGAIKQLRGELDRERQAKTEPIAIIGMGCRFPGGIHGPEAFWRALEDGVDGIREIDRWPPEAIPGDKPGVRWASLLDGIDEFDPGFFGISPREAVRLDPQQRLLLEVAWDALEDAGQVPSRLMGSRTGVFVGATSLDYQQRVASNGIENLDAYCLTGNLLCTAGGRLSFVLGLQGPNVSVDTACSSSLVAIHLACHSLRAGESDMALAAGVNVILSPITMAMLSATNALSPDGRCKSFDALANGYVRGEGCGVLALKRLSDAKRDGDRIWAVIRGSAVNQDGRSTGLTTPNVLAQQAVLEQALSSAGVSPNEIGYVEAHGTGTPLGDPIEMDALKKVLGRPTSDGAALVVGALKTNLGHLESSAGVAGIIKTALVLSHGRIPRNNHFQTLNPRISLERTRIVVAAEDRPWPREEGRARLAGVSSFGISGTNAHVILEEAPLDERDLPESGPVVQILPLSAKTPESLQSLAESFSVWLGQATGVSLRDVAYTASRRRMHHEHRLAVTGKTREQMASLLAAHVRGERPAGVVSGRAASRARAGLVYVFSGQGSQWLGMGRALLAEAPVFRAKLEECDALARTHAPWSILEELRAPEERSRIGETEIVQPLLFAIQVGLAALLASLGIEPDAVVGHSVGEIAAAHVAGALPLGEAMRLVVWRGRVMQKATGLGRMVSVGLTRAEAEAFIAGKSDRLAVAAINDPGSIVLSGETKALESVVAELSERGVSTQWLRVNYAFHSPQMSPLLGELESALGRMDTRASVVPMYSTVTGHRVEGSQLDVSYWRRNVRESVDFGGAVAAALSDGNRIFLEIGSHPVLLGNVRACAAETADVVSSHVLQRNAGDLGDVLRAVASLYVAGREPTWERSVPEGRCVSLPTYPFQRERCWTEIAPSRPSWGGVHASAVAEAHPLLGASFAVSTLPTTRVWEQSMGAPALAWLADHVVHGKVVVPGVTYLEMVAAAAAELDGGHQHALEDVSFERMLVLEGRDRIVQAVLADEDARGRTFTISSREEGGASWVRHAGGKVRALGSGEEAPARERPEQIRARCHSEFLPEDHYRRMADRGLAYGLVFRGVEVVWVGKGESVGRVRLPDAARRFGSAYEFFPPMFDACTQVIFGLLAVPGAVSLVEGAYIPVEVARVRFLARPGSEVWVHVRVVEGAAGGREAMTVDMDVLDDEGRVLVEVEGLFIQLVREAKLAERDTIEDCGHAIVWHRREHLGDASLAEPARAGGAWLVLCDRSGVGEGVAARLEARGDACIRVGTGSSFERSGGDRYRIDPTNAEHLRRLLREAFAAGAPCRGVVHLLALDGASPEAATQATVDRDLGHGLESACYLAQALLRAGMRDVPRLVLVTRGAQAMGSGATVDAVQATLWGFSRTVWLEHGELECTCVDLAPEPIAREPERIAAELDAGGGETQVALRGEGRYVARLARVPLGPSAQAELTFSPDAAYLITGGLGGLGLGLARWMVARGARRLMLVGRRAPSDEARRAVAEMEETGARVDVVAADVSRREDVEGVLARVDLPLKGIVHAAGIVDDQTLLELDGARIRRVAAPKVHGALHLHNLTKGQPLDFFVLYSSASSVLGSAGQAHYAAANAFLNGLAASRRGAGLPCVSIAWGPFSDVGLAAAGEHRGKRIAGRGVGSLSPEEGLQALERLLRRSPADIGVFRLDVRQWLESNPQLAGVPFWSELREAHGKASRGSGEKPFGQALLASPAGARRGLLEKHLIERLAQVLQLDPRRIDRDISFSALGVDSLMSLELRNRLEADVGQRLPATLLFTYTSPAALAGHLFEKLGLDEAKSAAAAPAEPRRAEPAPAPPAPTSPAPDAEDDLLSSFDASMDRIKRRRKS